MRFDIDVIEHSPRVRGQFGFGEEKLFPITFGMNEKGGMDEKEFEEYLMNSIVPLYPDARDKPGQRVILKVDSGPGRGNVGLLSKLKLLGFILYPCVPNTTHVTQETDRNYGPFKTQFFINLERLVSERIEAGVSLSLHPKLVGLPTFGGEDRETGCMIPLGAFERGFSRNNCISAWNKVGAVTSTGEISRACLEDPQVL